MAVIHNGGAPKRRLGAIRSQRFADLIIFSMCWIGVLAFSEITAEFKRSTFRSVVMALTAVAVTSLILHRRKVYDTSPTLPRTEEISRLFLAVLAGSSTLAVTAAFLDWHIGASEILIGGVVSFWVRILQRGMARAWNAESGNSRNTKPVILVGTGQEAKDLYDLMVDHPESQFSLAGVVGNLSIAERVGLGSHWLGPTPRLIELMHTHRATGAIVTATGFRGEQFHQITKVLFRSGYDVHLTTGVSRLGEGRFDVRSLCHEPLVVLERNKIRRSHTLAKRAIDICGASVALLLASPFMIMAMALIWLEDRGPITYTSPRIGRRGRTFRMYKFRSMVIDADRLKAKMMEGNERTGPLFKMSNDPRITRIGRIIRETSVDELPQLFNVLKGDMSLVGPRPALPEEEEQFDEELRDRYEVRPGITGLWQVEARSNAAFNAYRRLDLHYVENWTLGLDLRILLATVEQIATAVGLLPLRLIRPNKGRTDGVRLVNESSAHDAASATRTTESLVDLRDTPPSPNPLLQAARPTVRPPSVTAEYAMPIDLRTAERHPRPHQLRPRPTR